MFALGSLFEDVGYEKEELGSIHDVPFFVQN
jgi:hypothetical protein